MSRITTGRTHRRRVENARHAPRTNGRIVSRKTDPHLLEKLNPNSYYWQQQHKQALEARPAGLRGATWNTLVDLIWPGDEMIPWREAALKIRAATDLWLSGECDLVPLARKINQALKD